MGTFAVGLSWRVVDHRIDLEFDKNVRRDHRARMRMLIAGRISRRLRVGLGDCRQVIESCQVSSCPNNVVQLRRPRPQGSFTFPELVSPAYTGHCRRRWFRPCPRLRFASGNELADANGPRIAPRLFPRRVGRNVLSAHDRCRQWLGHPHNRQAETVGHRHLKTIDGSVAVRRVKRFALLRWRPIARCESRPARAALSQAGKNTRADPLPCPVRMNEECSDTRWVARGIQHRHPSRRPCRRRTSSFVCSSRRSRRSGPASSTTK